MEKIRAKHTVGVRLLHWIMALLIVGNISMAWLMTPFENENPGRDQLYFLHKSFGVTLLVLIVIRIVLKLRTAPLPLPKGIPKAERKLAKIAHTSLYGLMIAMPVLGYVQSSAYEYSDGVHFFGLLVPEIIPDDEQIFDIANTLHRVLGYSLFAVVILHVVGVLKHQLFDKPENNVLTRML